ncbi:DUF861 domain-containing protein [Duganella sp. FT92W]|uniref:DUF861 domain-containing protein n=2 Tax=Pseudoduganella rivuli TaxID=2666085 RepID=A0A7X2IKW2_9BURK|nr:DUF861 domain-containing protein [Pseudoduganella rivuli]
MSNMQQAAATQSTPARIPTFIDLRAFARDSAPGHPLPEVARDDVFLSSRRLLDLALGPVTVGVMSLPAGGGLVPCQPADEFIIVCAGKLTLTVAEQGRTLVLGPNNSAVIQHGAAFSWSAQEPVSVIFMRHGGSQPDGRGIVPVREHAPMAPSNPPLAELLLTPAPACRNHTDHRSTDGTFSCGIWDSTPYHRRAMLYRHHELMYLLEGSVTFVDESGRSGTFSKGDIFLVEQNARCSWESRDRVAKVFALYRPA